MYEKKYTASNVIDDNAEPYMVYFEDGTNITVILDRRLTYHLGLSGKKSFFKALIEKSYGKPVRTLFYMKDTGNGLCSHILHLPMQPKDNGAPKSQVITAVSVWGCLHGACEWLQTNYNNELMGFFRLDGVKYKLDLPLLNRWFSNEITEEELLDKLRKGKTS